MEKHMDLPALKDTDKMPFGFYARSGKIMQDVPASYLHFLWTNGLKAQLGDRSRQGMVARYIQSNMDALKKEHTDGIWD